MNDETRTPLGRLLIAGRKRRGLSQQQLAALSGVSSVTIAAIETGRNSKIPRVDTLKNLAVALGFDLWAVPALYDIPSTIDYTDTEYKLNQLTNCLGITHHVPYDVVENIKDYISITIKKYNPDFIINDGSADDSAASISKA